MFGIACKKELSREVGSLDKLSFTLDDFNKLSNGKFNAGCLKLDSKGRLDIANNHCESLSFLNTTEISVSESFTIRRAFAQALETAGVDAKAMKDIRKQLGLGSTANTFASGKSFLPLTRQEVREIIDANINAINEHRGLLDQIQTQSDKYNGLSTEERTEMTEMMD